MPDNATQKSNSSSPIQKVYSVISPTSPTGNKRKRSRHRNRGRGKPAVTPVVQRGPVKEYTSECCQASAKKPSTGKPIGSSEKQKVGTKADPTAVHGVGKWRCGSCGKRCKVTTQTPKIVEEVPIAQPGN
jgi:hypothetical protein